jgi:hypothetical protein
MQFEYSPPRREDDMMKMKPLELVKAEPVQASFGFGGPNVTPIRAPSPDSRTEQLMPYEAVAKTIYVRANGLPAYRRTTGHIRRVSDGGGSETK